MIGGNGCYVESEGEVVMHQLITAEQCRHIVDWLHARGLEFYLESNNGLFASERFREEAGPVMRLYAKGKGASDEDAETSAHAFMDALIYGGELYRDDLNKVSFILSSYQDHLDSVEEFPDLVARTWGGKGEHALFGDLGVKGSTRRTPSVCSWNTWARTWQTPSPWATPRSTSPCSRAAARACAWAVAATRPRPLPIGSPRMWTTTACGTPLCTWTNLRKLQSRPRESIYIALRNGSEVRGRSVFT